MKDSKNDFNPAGMSTGKRTPNAGPESGAGTASGLASRMRPSDVRDGDSEGNGGRPGPNPGGTVKGPRGRNFRWG